METGCTAYVCEMLKLESLAWRQDRVVAAGVEYLLIAGGSWSLSLAVYAPGIHADRAEKRGWHPSECLLMRLKVGKPASSTAFSVDTLPTPLRSSQDSTK